MKLNTLIAVTFILMLSACASTPEPQPKIAENTQPAPVIEQPAPIERAPVETIVPEYQGPQPGTVDHFKFVSGDDRVYFGFNEYTLTAQTREVLKSQVRWLQEYSGAIVVIGGNADERGTREYNLALGARRADAVKDFFVSQGISSGRITTVSYGKERPIDGRSNEEAWALNRNAHSAVLVGGNS